METYYQKEDRQLFGRQVPTFPDGVKDAFEAFQKTLDNGDKRDYFGLSRMSGESIQYWVAAQPIAAGEEGDYERLVMPKGGYLSVPLKDWPLQLHCLKDIFGELMNSEYAHPAALAVEWYYSASEMLCMLQEHPQADLFRLVDTVMNELLAIIEPMNEEELNEVPFADSWTPAQLATHITKSNTGIAQALDMKGIPTKRDPAAGIEGLKKTFLDFSTRLNSPEFIRPRAGRYERQQLITALKKSNDDIRQKRKAGDLTEEIDFAAFGTVTKIELLHFVVYHTQRHVHQLKKMVKANVE